MSIYIDYAELVKRHDNELATTHATLNRILAKTHPNTLPEDDPDRKYASNLIAARAMAKMMAENRVRDYYGYAPSPEIQSEDEHDD